MPSCPVTPVLNPLHHDAYYSGCQCEWIWFQTHWQYKTTSSPAGQLVCKCQCRESLKAAVSTGRGRLRASDACILQLDVLLGPGCTYDSKNIVRTGTGRTRTRDVFMGLCLSGALQPTTVGQLQVEDRGRGQGKVIGDTALWGLVPAAGFSLSRTLPVVTVRVRPSRRRSRCLLVSTRAASPGAVTLVLDSVTRSLC